MFNDSVDELIFLKEGLELKKSIIKSLDQAKKVILSNLQKTTISASEVTSSSKNPLRRATLFKFFDDHKINNSGLYDRRWVEKIFLISSRVDIPEQELKKVFTKKGLQHHITNVFRGAIKLDAKLIMHLLWCNKAVLLPYGYPLPYSNGRSDEYAASTYPEVLAITQKVHLKDSCLNKYPDLFVPHGSKDNFSWYFKNFIRSSPWWKIEDISTDDINQIILSDLSETPSRQSQIQMLRTWLGFFEKTFPDRVKFNLDETLSIKSKAPLSEYTKSGKLRRSSISLTKSNSLTQEHFSFLPEKQKENIAIWLNYIDLWEKKLGQKKVLTAGKKKAHIYQLINYFVYEVYKKNNFIPTPSEFNRQYLDGVDDGIVGLNDYLAESKSLSSVQNIIYNINQFFNFLELYKDEIGDFTNIISLKIDVPFVPRRKSTTKKIFPSEYYAPFLSYLYALAEWVWWMKSFCQTKEGCAYVLGLEASNDKRIWITAETGFIPIFWFEGIAIPINVIPRYIAPVIYRRMRYSPEKITPSVLPNYINISVVLSETGIRSTHVHWLDSRSYDEFVDRQSFNPYSFDITKLHVNTDKVNGAWTCYTSQSVIGVLDRQKEYQKLVMGENVKDLVDYSWNPNSPYMPIECLFSLGNASRKQHKKNSGPSSPEAYGGKYRCLLYGFNVALSHLDNFEPFMNLEETSEKFNTEEYFKAVYPIKNNDEIYISEITPHSARSQVVSKYISLLPPSVIRSITGHATDSHLVYYAQLDNMALDKARNDTINAMEGGLLFENKLSSIKAEDINSKLRVAFQQSRASALEDFGATSFSSLTENKGSSFQRCGLIEVKKQPSDQIAFNSTHICPFDNQCPSDVKKEFNGSDQHKPCGRCFYAVKTVDHLPRIYGKIRSLTDECNELESYIRDGKDNDVSKRILEEASQRRRILADDIVGWTVSTHCLEKMANELYSKDKWLVEKPELLTQHIKRMECKDGELESLLLRVAEAKNHAEFFTSSLKHQITKARTKLLAHTGQFNKLLIDAPDDYTLLDEFRGQIKSICQATNISVSDLSKYLDTPLNSMEASNTPFRLLSTSGESNNDA